MADAFLAEDTLTLALPELALRCKELPLSLVLMGW